MAWYGGWAPYVPVARRRANAANYAAQVAKKEKRNLAPVKIVGKQIAESFWGKAWCENLERYSDFSNRLPRGRTYVRNGSVVDLQIEQGQIRALVAGSDVYKVTITIGTLESADWKRIKHDCSQSIDSLIDLLQGRLSQGIMQRLTERDSGLFPHPRQITIRCSCPDSARVCKHVAAVMYGVGARLDASPELLFTLRAVDHLELISQAVAAENLDRTLAAGQNGALAGSDLGELFGIEIDAGDSTLQNAGKGAGKSKSDKLTPAAKKPRATRQRADAVAMSVKILDKIAAKVAGNSPQLASKTAATNKTAAKKATTKIAANKIVTAKKPAGKKRTVKTGAGKLTPVAAARYKSS